MKGMAGIAAVGALLVLGGCAVGDGSVLGPHPGFATGSWGPAPAWGYGSGYGTAWAGPNVAPALPTRNLPYGCGSPYCHSYGRGW